MSRRVSIERLSQVKYSGLQRLAKEAGLKSNVKQTKLVSVLEKYFADKSQDNEAIERELKILEEEEDCGALGDIVTLSDVNDNVTVRSRRASTTELSTTPVDSFKERGAQTSLKRNVRSKPEVDLTTNGTATSGADNFPRLALEEPISEEDELTVCRSSAEKRRKEIEAELERRVRNTESSEGDNSCLEEDERDICGESLGASKANFPFAKAHQKQFDQMDSISQYLNKKRERREQLLKSHENTSLSVKRSREAVHKSQASKTPNSKFGCSTAETKTSRLRGLKRKSSPVEAFVPQALTPSKLTFQFSSHNKRNVIACAGKSETFTFEGVHSKPCETFTFQGVHSKSAVAASGNSTPSRQKEQTSASTARVSRNLRKPVINNNKATFVSEKRLKRTHTTESDNVEGSYSSAAYDNNVQDSGSASASNSSKITGDVDSDVHNKAHDEVTVNPRPNLKRKNTRGNASNVKTHSVVSHPVNNNTAIPVRATNKAVPGKSEEQKIIHDRLEDKTVQQELNDGSKAGSSRQRQKFDLQASLSRKLSYKPYTGPLRPFADSTKNKINSTTSIKVADLRAQRRNNLQATRQQKKDNALMARRGILQKEGSYRS